MLSLLLVAYVRVLSLSSNGPAAVNAAITAALIQWAAAQPAAFKAIVAELPQDQRVALESGIRAALAR